MDLKLVENDCNHPSNEEAADVSIAGYSVTSCLPQAMAPPGFIMVDACTPLDTRCQQRSLVGRMILYGWEDDDRTDWFVGRVAHNRLTLQDYSGSYYGSNYVSFGYSITTIVTRVVIFCGRV